MKKRRRSFFSDGELNAEERAKLRALLAQAEALEEGLTAAQVAKAVGLKPRAVLNLARRGEAFPNHWKPAHNKLRIPPGDVVEFKLQRRMTTP